MTRTLENLGVGTPEIDMSAGEVMQSVMTGCTVHLSSVHRIVRRRVGGEQRVEIIPGPNTAHEDMRSGGTFQRAGFQIEMMNYKRRSFIPNSEAGAMSLQGFMQGKNTINVTMARDQQGRQRVDHGPYVPYSEAMAESRVYKSLRAELDRLGFKDVDLQFDPSLVHQGRAYADHFGRMVVTIGNTLNPRWTLGHEALHIYWHMGLFTREEWSLLSETAEADWMDRYAISARYPDLTREEQIEEAVAEAFGEVYETKSRAFIREPLVVQALRKIANFLKAVRNWARGLGMQTSGDIIHAMARGTYARKAEINARPRGWQSQTDRLMKHQRSPGLIEETRGALHLLDRRVWDALFGANEMSIRERLREARGGVNDTTDQVRVRIQDRMLPFLRSLERIEAVMGAPVPDDLNVYLGEEMYSGRAGYKLDQIEHDYFEPIMDLIAKTKGVTAETVGRYLYARHAVERNERIAEINPDMPDGGSGMSSEEAALILSEIEGSDTAEVYREIGKKVDALREWSIQLRVDAGLMSEFQSEAWRKAYANYVPLKGWAETDNADAEMDMTGLGRGYNMRGQESRMAMGRRSEAFNPLIAALTQAQEAVVRSEKNPVGQHLYRLAKDLPSKNLWTVKRAETRRVFNETTGLVEERAFSPITLIQAANEFAVKVGGEEHRVMLHDPRLARAMGLVGTNEMIGPVRALSLFSPYFSTINTMLNPPFLPKNVMRDMLTATINVRRFPNSARIQRRMLRDWPKALAGAYRGLGGKADTKWAKYFREFDEAGGKVSFWIIENPEASQARLERMARRRSGPIGMAAGMLTPRISENPFLAAIERINLAADNAVRLAAFVAAREEGYTIQEAASLGKNLTVNFNRRGEWGRSSTPPIPSPTRASRERT
ncbi:hypothetical protein [Rhodophyticola porphyridii]|uniref:Uncharacterized protein n=1 Tax=Rhodophyticola porphyridii TaxID=1852017 RepID=A0A3L9Y4A4_9RHOB|nr:hypothetical protein [Rhodophyticola porphyridii]RMA42158.1 hypothetical protein D9R08_11985 [Rhodophyticola porphyridii]